MAVGPEEFKAHDNNKYCVDLAGYEEEIDNRLFSGECQFFGSHITLSTAIHEKFRKDLIEIYKKVGWHDVAFEPGLTRFYF